MGVIAEALESGWGKERMVMVAVRANGSVVGRGLVRDSWLVALADPAFLKGDGPVFDERMQELEREGGGAIRPSEMGVALVDFDSKTILDEQGHGDPRVFSVGLRELFGRSGRSAECLVSTMEDSVTKEAGLLRAVSAGWVESEKGGCGSLRWHPSDSAVDFARACKGFVAGSHEGVSEGGWTESKKVRATPAGWMFVEVRSLNKSGKGWSEGGWESAWAGAFAMAVGLGFCGLADVGLWKEGFPSSISNPREGFEEEAVSRAQGELLKRTTMDAAVEVAARRIGL